MEIEVNRLLKHAQELECRGSFWEAGEAYKDALLAFNKLSDFKEEKALCKKKIREMTLKRAEDFKELAAEYRFSAEEKIQVEKFVSWCVDADTLYGSLKRIGTHPNFYPKYKQVLDSSRQNMPVAFLIASLSAQDEQGNLERDGHDGHALSYANNYGIHQGVSMQLYLLPVLQKIMEAKMKFEDLSAYFKSSELFSENMLKTFDVGLERFMSRDYVSSMHILAPLFEKTFIDITTAIGGADTVASRGQSGAPDKIWTQDKTLGEGFLKNEDVRKVWGEDFCEQINFVMLAPLGYKLRHKIAHGYAAFDEFNFANNALLLYFFLVIAARVGVNERAS